MEKPLPAKPAKAPESEAEKTSESKVAKGSESKVAKDPESKPAESESKPSSPEVQAPAPEPKAEVPAAPDQATLIAEAELRGYLRGRNEAIERLMREPSTLERPAEPATSSAEPESAPMILNTPHISIWDR